MEEKRTRKANREGTIAQRGDGRWEAKFTDPGSGKRRSVYGKTRDEAVVKLAEAQKKIASGTLPTENLTVGEWLTRWLGFAKGRVRPKTYQFYEFIVRVHLTPVIGKYKLAELSPEIVDRLLANKEGQVSGQTIAHIRSVLRAALNKAAARGYVVTNAAALADPPAFERHEIEPLSIEELHKFLDVIAEHPKRALFLLAASTGMRQGELLGLLWQHVDLGRGEIEVLWQRQRINGEYVLTEPKSKRSRRVVPLPGIAIDALRRHQQEQSVERVTRGEGWHETGYVFTTRDGKPLAARGPYETFKRLLEKAGIDERRFHDLRHTFATLALQSGVEPVLVQNMLGHSTISLTLDTYTHVPRTMAHVAAEKVDGVFRRSITGGQ